MLTSPYAAMQNVRPPTGRALVLSFGAVAATFTIAIALTQAYSVRVRAAAREITGNAAPSISRLSSMRGTMRQLEVYVDDHVDGCQLGPCDPAPPRLASLRQALRADWRAYVLLPTFPHEPDSWPEVEALLGRVDEALSRYLEDLGHERPRVALEVVNGTLKPDIDALDAAVARLVESDHEQSVALAAHIDRLARRSMVMAVLLDVASVSLTALAAMFAIRLVRRYERLQRERLEDLDQFAGRVAHDLLNPIGTMLGAVELARRDGDPRGGAALDLAERGARRARRIVDGLLAFTRGGTVAGASATASLREVVADVVEEHGPAAERHRISLEVEGVPDAEVACSPGLLTSVVANLVGNAIKYMGGSVVREVAVRAEVLPGGQVVRVEVEDSGPGVPDDLGERVFEPFVRGEGDQPGVGLGLATARRVVTAHGGRIGFARGQAGGTVFWFELPAAARAARQARAG